MILQNPDGKRLHSSEPMEIELVEIRDFLAQRPPFDVLPEEQLNQLPKLLDIRYLRRTSAFPPVDAQRSYIYILRSGAVELLDEDIKLVEKLGEGDIYTTECQLIDFGRAIRGVATEDTDLLLRGVRSADYALIREGPDKNR
jgi:CBS domain-containing protein